jgi:hypothetical protein
MPLTPQEKYKRVVDAGLDPTKFTYQEDSGEDTSGNIPTVESFNPYDVIRGGPVPQEAEPIAPKTTSLGALTSGALQSLLPTGASLGAMRLGLKIPGPPIVKGIGAIATGLGAGYLANKIQSGAMDSFLPESIKNTLAAQQDEHGVASLLGELLPGFGIGGPGGIIGELGKVFTPATISRSKLGQAAIGSALQMGMEGYREYNEGKGFDPLKLGISAVAGGLQNEPTSLGRKVLGLPKMGVPEVETYTPPAKPIIKPTEPVPAVKPPIDITQQEGIEQLRKELQGQQVKPSLTEDTSEVVREGQPPNRPPESSVDNPTSPDDVYWEIGYKNPNGTKSIAYGYGDSENIQKIPKDSIIYKRQGEPSPDQVQARRANEYTPDPTEKFYQEEAIRRKVPGVGISNELGTHSYEPIMSISDDPQDYRNVKSREAIKKGQMFVKEGPQYDSQTGKRILSEAGPGESLTPEQLQQANELAYKRGVTLQKEPGIISEVTGQEARGYAIPDERVARVNPNTATSDTPSHEIGHNYLRDLRRSSNLRDVEFYNKGIKAAGNEENLAEALGKRVSEIESRPLRTWLEDASNYVASKVGLAEEDASKGLARRLRDDRPYNESPEFRSAVDKVNKIYSERASSESSSTKGEETKGTSFGLGFLKPVVDKIREFSPVAAKAVENTEIENRQLNGKITNSFIENAKRIKDKENSVRYIWESRYGGPKVILNPTDRALIDGPINKTYRLVHEEQRANGPLIEGRQAIDNPNLKGPNIISQKVLDTLINKPQSSAERQKLVNDFIQHQTTHFKDVTPEMARENFNSLLRGFSPAGDKNTTAAFNALRKAEGFGIPWSWMEKDPVKLFQRYGNRVARDLAYYRNIENDPEVAALFGHTTRGGVEPIVNNSIQVAQRRLTGQHTTSETTYNAIEHFVRSLLLGPATGIKNTISTLGQILPYVSVKDIPKIAEAFGQIKRGFKDSMDLGVNRHSITSIETGDIGGGLGRFSENLKALGDVIRKYTGSNAIEQWTRAHNMALGEILTESYWGRATKGDINARKFLRMFAPGGETLDFRNLSNLPDSVKLETAARFVERVQGTYGLRGLPSFLLEPTSPVFWFMSLAKWSVEKANVISKDVIGPALKGDVGPLLRYSLGGLLTGEAIRSIGEELMNKKTNTPDLKEMADKGDVSDYVYKAFELSSLAGLGGLYSDLAKLGGDLVKGYSTRGYNIPSAEIAKDITTEIGNASQAISEGQKPLSVVMSLVQNILTDNIQAVRMVSNQAHPEEMERADRFRDKRVYDKLSGKNVPAPEGRTDRYGSMAEREFKRAKTTEEAKQIYKEDIVPKLQTLPKEDRKKEVSNLKRNSYQTVPADRKEAEQYYQYIRRTQGVDAMVKLKKDKMEQDRVNRRKSQMVH